MLSSQFRPVKRLIEPIPSSTIMTKRRLTTKATLYIQISVLDLRFVTSIIEMRLRQFRTLNDESTDSLVASIPLNRLDALLKQTRHSGQTRRIAVSRVDILISASAPDCSRAPVNKKRNRKREGKRGGEEPESAGKKSEKLERKG